ncbi:hypothetical protein WMY93_007996 [Mugilogobius chulae]|uniref:Family with sequence similarity 222 member B n=1 Tax=Mugilogobius chulae TaxID=88201 RepID=A0AAW0PFV4_9GOBI
MLACLPGPGDLPLQLLPHTQMNTGLQKWDTTQRMRSTPFPTPSELDAYAKKVANNPLTIKIFPNSIKVPQRNHVRRTVNGLDTSGQRYSPYPSTQPSSKAGLLAIVKGPPVKGIVKDYDGSRARLHPDINMNAHAGPYQVGPNSTLNHHPTPHTLPRPPHNMSLPQDLPQSIQLSLPQQQGHMLRHAPPIALHPQGPPRPPTQHSTSCHPQGTSALMLQQSHHQQQQAPPVLPGAGRCQMQGHHTDLSAIVHQINQFCQARAHHSGAASMCEGQIANPSPISRNLLISACSRVSMHTAPGFPPPNCTIAPQEKSTTLVGAAPPSAAAMNHLPSNRTDIKQHLHHLHPQQSQPIHHGNTQQKMRSWNQHHLGHLGHMQNGGAHLAKQPSRDPNFHFKGMGYSNEVCGGQPYQLKPL